MSHTIPVAERLKKQRIINLNDSIHFKNEVNKNWHFWRPIVHGVLTYTEASEITEYELIEANFALDRKIKESNPKRKR